MDKREKENIKKFFSEIQMLKRVKNEGVRLAGVKEPDSVAEHGYISAQIAYVLAKLEGADPAKCVLINLFNNNAEVRAGNKHRISTRYIDSRKIMREAEKEHFEGLPKYISAEIIKSVEEKREKNTKEGVIAQDANSLEQAIQAKIYVEEGYKGCEDWINNVSKVLETDSAKELLAEIRNDPDFLNCWWRGLKRLVVKKLPPDKVKKLLK